MVDLTAEEEEEEQPQQQANAGGLPLAAQAHLVSVKRSHGLAFGASEAAAGQDLEQRQQGAAAEGVEGGGRGGQGAAPVVPQLRLERCQASALLSLQVCLLLLSGMPESRLATPHARVRQPGIGGSGPSSPAGDTGA